MPRLKGSTCFKPSNTTLGEHCSQKSNGQLPPATALCPHGESSKRGVRDGLALCLPGVAPWLIGQSAILFQSILPCSLRCPSLVTATSTLRVICDLSFSLSLSLPPASLILPPSILSHPCKFPTSIHKLRHFYILNGASSSSLSPIARSSGTITRIRC